MANTPNKGQENTLLIEGKDTCENKISRDKNLVSDEHMGVLDESVGRTMEICEGNTREFNALCRMMRHKERLQLFFGVDRCHYEVIVVKTNRYSRAIVRLNEAIKEMLVAYLEDGILCDEGVNAVEIFAPTDVDADTYRKEMLGIFLGQPHCKTKQVPEDFCEDGLLRFETYYKYGQIDTFITNEGKILNDLRNLNLID